MRHQYPAAHAARAGAARRIRFARPYARAVCPRCGVLVRLNPESNVLLAHDCSLNEDQGGLKIITA